MGTSTRRTSTSTTSTTSTTTTTSGAGTTTEIGQRQGPEKKFTGPTLDRDRDGPAIQALLNTFGGPAMDNFDYGFLDEIELAEGDIAPETESLSSLLPEWASTAPEGIWGQVQQTGRNEVMDAIEAGFPSNSMLYVAFGPENLPKLDLAEEVTALQGGVDNLVVVWNPSQLALRALAESGGFATAIIAGHGAAEGGGVYMTDDDGKALPTTADEFAALFEGTSIETIFLNACNGLAGDNSVADALNEVGVHVLGWMEEVKDSEAIEATETLVALAGAVQDGASPSELEAVADAFDGPGGNLVAEIVDEAGTGDAEAVAQAVSDVVPTSTGAENYDPYAFYDYGMGGWL